MTNGFIIAIDGPVASGKGTVAPALASMLHGFHIYTGGTYRAFALYCLRNNVNLSDTSSVIDALNQVEINLVNDRILLNSEDVTEEIKKSDVADASSKISVLKDVREAMVDLQQVVAQREIQNGKAVVAEGRDTATKVFPQADLKVFLTAGDNVRAKRRQSQFDRMGKRVELEVVLEDIRQRDKRDSERVTDPLVTEPEKFGYFVVDNTLQTLDETIKVIIDELKRRELL